MPTTSPDTAKPLGRRIAARGRASLSVALALVLAATASCGAASEQSAAVRDLDRKIEVQNFNPKLGDKVFRAGKSIVKRIFYHGQCIPLSDGWLHTGKIPYGKEFGPDARAADSLARAIVNDIFFEAEAGASYGVRFSSRFTCPAPEIEARFKDTSSLLKIYFETDRAAYRRRKVELAAKHSAINSDQHGRLPDRCAIYGSADRYWMGDVSTVILADKKPALDLSDATQIACMARASAVAVGQVGVINISDRDLLHEDYQKELERGTARSGGYWNFTGRVAFDAPLVPGMGKDEAMKLIRETERYNFWVNYFIKGRAAQ